MKKLILIAVLIMSCIGLFGQNVFKYEIKANGGLTVGHLVVKDKWIVDNNEL